jgi:hypothetical protein
MALFHGPRSEHRVTTDRAAVAGYVTVTNAAVQSFPVEARLVRMVAAPPGMTYNESTLAFVPLNEDETSLGTEQLAHMQTDKQP